MRISWVKRFGYEMSAKTSAPGVYRLKAGGYFVRSPFGQRALHEATLPEAVAVRETLTKPPVSASTLPLFATFATELLDEKILLDKVESAATEERYRSALDHYLFPYFGRMRVDEIQHHHIIAWTVTVAKWIKLGKPSLRDSGKTVNCAASTANGWLRLLRTVINKMVARFHLPMNPFNGVEFFTEKRTYTEEEPNSLSPAQVKTWLRIAKKLYPQHFVMMLLGFVTGRRAGELRPLRRGVDVDHKKNQILIRRSHSRKQVAMDRTKTKKDLVLNMPDEIMHILKEHEKTLPKGGQYLFPALAKNSARHAKTITFNRQQLYKDVWSEAVRTVAKRYGVSDVTLSKTCRRIGIPLPPQGYWLVPVARRGERPPLPPMADKSCNQIVRIYGDTMRSRSCLDKPFRAVAKAMKLTFKLTPRAMRRSFQDLAREAQIEAIVGRALSGHRTTEMQELYSTVRAPEQLKAVQSIMRLVQ